MIKRFFLVLMICLYICSCGGSSDSKNKNGGQEQPNGGTAGTNNDPAHPDGSGAGGIGTDVTKGDMKDAEPMEMTNGDFFEKALSLETFENFTIELTEEYEDSGEPEIRESFFQKESNMRFHSIGDGEFVGEESEKWCKESSDADNPYRIKENDGPWQNMDELSDVFFQRDIICFATVCNDISKYEYDNTEKCYKHTLTEAERIDLIESVEEIELQGTTNVDLKIYFVGNLVRKMVVNTTDHYGATSEIIGMFSYYTTTVIDMPADE